MLVGCGFSSNSIPKPFHTLSKLKMATASFWQNNQVVLGGISVAYREGLVCGSTYNSEFFYLEVMEHEESETREEGDTIASVDPMSVGFHDVIDCGDDNTFFLQGKICPAYCRCRRCDTCPRYCRCRRLVMKKARSGKTSSLVVGVGGLSPSKAHHKENKTKHIATRH